MVPLYRYNLLLDGSLRVETTRELASAVEPWLPWRLPSGSAVPPSPAGLIEVSSGRPTLDEVRQPPILRLGSVTAETTDLDSIVLRGIEGSTTGSIDLTGLRAELGTVGDAASVPWPDEEGIARGREAIARSLFSMLTLSSAFLLGRMGRTLLHAGAVVGPDGRAWLLVGDSRSGKTSTVLTLIRAGWPVLSDDHVVVSSGSGGVIEVEGWPRTFHVDEGWSAGEVTGRREDLPLDRLGEASFRRRAPLGGVLFPEVHPDRKTGSVPSTPGAALQGIIRQSPWLLADRRVAPALLGLLRRVATMPSFSLTLARDSYGNPAVLTAALPHQVAFEELPTPLSG